MAECVGCGYCCIKTPCEAARRLYLGVKECPQLLWSEEKNRYECGLMLLPGKIGQGYREELYAGAGCSCSLNDWRKDVKPRISTTSMYNVNPLPSLMQKFIRALANEFVCGDTITLALYNLEVILKQDGYDEAEIKNISKAIVYNFTENRDKFVKDFIG